MGVQAVSTTGIYCRPECSARPLERHVAHFASPVAAEAAGYRSCLRCRPDRGVRTDDLSGAPTAVVGALGLISDGYLDRFDEAALARRIGYSVRQLRRLFERHIGATPAFVARSRRAHFARRLLDETECSMSVIARASGFGSVRQMNRVMHTIFGFGPRELRTKRRARDVLVADGGLRLRLPFIEPLDRDAIRDHLAPRAVPSIERVESTVYRRTLAVCGNPGVLEVDLAGEEPHLELVAHLPTFDSIIDDVSRTRQMLGLDDPGEPATRHLGSDPVLGRLVRSRPGLRVVGGWDRFETAVRVVVGQQVSVAAAATLTDRIVGRHGVVLPGRALRLTHVFPTADALCDLDADSLGMPQTRAETVRALSRAVVASDVDLHSADRDEVRSQLTSVPGIGPWTAEVILMRALRDPDAFPASDLGVRHAVRRLLGCDELPSQHAVATMAEHWRPHRALACQHLWTSLRAPEPEEQS